MESVLADLGRIGTSADATQSASPTPVSLFAESASEDQPTALCGICNTQYSRYTCPRCSIQYCSLKCYKHEGHADCSEGFYKTEFMDAMNTKVANEDEKKQMMSMLQSFEAENAESADSSSRDDQIADLYERMKDIDLDDSDEVWAKLTASERARFQDTAHLASLLVRWNPWWSSEGEAGANAGSGNGIELLHNATASPTDADDVSEDEDDSDAQAGPLRDCQAGSARRERAKRPEIATDVQPFEELLRGKQPAKELVFNLVELVYAYAYVCIRYNGDVDLPSAECAEALLTISGVLGKDMVYENIGAAVVGCMQNVAQDEALFVDAGVSTKVIDDVTHIFSAEDNISAALSHAHRIMERMCTGPNKVVVTEGGKGARRRFKLAVKKLYFYLSWWLWLCSKENESAGPESGIADALRSAVQGELTAERMRRIQELRDVDEGKRSIEKQWRGPLPSCQPPLIQEL
eukprot:m.652017 g.652017  ORF g.652017 m.652017 type:complete len:464 (+) comp22687_c0_seq2:258-1649(+)